MRKLFQLLYLILLIIIKGVVVCQLWSWFITPLFGIPEISCAMGIGLVTMFSVVQVLLIPNFKDYEQEFEYNILIGIKPLVLLLVGWIVQLFI